MKRDMGICILSEDNDPFALMLKHWISECSFSVINTRDTKSSEIAVYSPHLAACREQLPEGVSLIFCSDCAPAAAFAAQHTGPLLDYGFSHTDTLTFSSLTEQQAVIALQRPIVSRTGEALEPLEIPISLSEGTDPELLLPAAAICLLADRLDALTLFP